MVRGWIVRSSPPIRLTGKGLEWYPVVIIGVPMRYLEVRQGENHYAQD